MVSAGTRLGVYEVVVPIGSGGMGEVYRARDTRIDRHVALKVLPEAFARDGDRVLRFEREAKLLGSLNHPCIAALYGTEQSDGRLFLVMELVEGETLSDRILRGPMPVEEALAIARQIAEALEAAHEAGVIHRDLKPANVKITPDDRVKVLDFGLAKVADHQPAAASVTQSPTLSMATEAGVILGTAAYMSPEQAKGTAVDQRSDVFSFGCVLYEMLMGRRPFPGETTPDVLASIVARDPDYSVLPPNLNPRLYELLRRCLEKNPRRRWQAVGDLRAEIEAMIAAPRVAPAMAHAAAPSRPLWRRAMPVLVTAIVVAALTSLVWWSARESLSPAQPTIRLSIRVPAGQQLPSIASRLVTISPDGMQVAYALNGLLYARSLSASDPTSIGSTEGLQASHPVFSPDGQALAFHSNRDRTLKRIALSGGAAVTIGEDIDLPYGMSWGPNGILVGQVGKGIVRVLPNGGKPELIIPTKPGELAHGPQMLPGGNTVLFTLSTATGSEQWDGALIVVQSLDSGMRTTVIEGGSDARYLPSGHIVYAIGGSLFAVPFDVNRLTVTGGSVPVVEGVRRTPRSGTAQFAFSENGTLIYLRGPAFASFSQRDLAMIDRTGAVEFLKVQRDAYESPRVSPDGKRIAVSTDTGREANIWIFDLAGASSLRRLTFGGRNRFPLWSPDGQWIVFQSDRDGDLGLFRQRADVSGTAERLTKPDPGVARSGILVASRTRLVVQRNHSHGRVALDSL